MGKRVNNDRLCEIEGCDRLYLAKGMCSMHYQRVLYTGDPHKVRSMKPGSFTISERLKSHIVSYLEPDYEDPRVLVTPEDGKCWMVDFTSSGSRKQYTQFSVHGRLKYTHRVAYEEWVGPIPEGLYIDHRCRVTRCVNPKHLEAVTASVNKRRGYALDQRKENQ